MKMRIAVIGIGNIARKSIIPAILNSSNAELVVCIDRTASKENEIKKLYGCEFSTSLEDANQKFKFDCVYISTPVGVHKDLIIQSAKLKKHILCEKSIVSNYLDSLNIIEICKENRVALFECFMYQFHPQHEIIRQLIGAGEIGTPLHVQAWFGFPPINKSDFRYSSNLGGGATLDAGSYTVHFARNFFREEPIEVFSILENENHEIDIRGSVMLNFGKSRTAHCVYGFNNFYQNNYAIWGSEGKITLSRAFSLPAEVSSNLIIEKKGFESKSINMPKVDHFQIQIENFITGYNSETTRELWYDDIKAQALVISKILKSNIKL
jgi:NDP-hexose-3-ketoreductase